MHGFEYERLSAADKRFYDNFCSQLEKNLSEYAFENVSYDYIDKIFRIILRDNPQLFWFNGASRAQISKSPGKTVVRVYPEFRDGLSRSRVEVMRNEFNRVCDKIVSSAKWILNPYKKILYVHDYIVDNTDYALNAPNCYTPYGCLVDRRAVCAGYAKAFQYLMNLMNIPCGRVTGASRDSYSRNVDHEWNYVGINGEFYFIDVTWDDPVAEGSSSKNNKTYNYFCIPESELLLTHRIIDDRIVPRCTHNDYNYYVYNKMYLQTYSFDAVARLAQSQLSGGSFTVKFSTQIELQKAVRDLMQNQRVYDIKGISHRILYDISKSNLILTVTNN